MLVRIDGQGVFGWPIGHHSELLTEQDVVRLPYRTSRSGLTVWEIIIPRKWVSIVKRVNLYHTLRQSAIDALEWGIGFYLPRVGFHPWEAQAVFPATVRETEAVSNWRQLWYAFALAWKGERKKFALSPAMATRLLEDETTRAISKRHFSTYFGGQFVHLKSGEWMLLFK